MRYIPGFEFTVGQKQQSIKSGSLLEQNKKKKHDVDFTMGNTYKLYYIECVNDNFKYTFLNLTNTQDDPKHIIFKSIFDADERISKIVGG